MPDDDIDPKTLERQKSESETATLASFSIEIKKGAGIGARLRIDASVPSRVFVGKSPACELVVDDPLVSRRHIALELEASRLRLTDLDSTNGTLVNGVSVAEAFLHGSEIISIGDAVLAVSNIGPAVRVRLPAATRFGRVLGGSDVMRRLYPLCERLALSDVSVVIEGETGTGKELLAESIHEASPRASGPFVVFDCTTGPHTLLEAALFGHEKGAFTGAEVARAGVFEQAHGGTLFIDEIGDLDVALQGKLLRALQSGEVQRLGSSTWFKSDVRVLAATRRDLERQVQSGAFRDDLYYRLAVARIELPPLRRRHGDVSLLGAQFWRALTKEPIPLGFLERLEAYGWPGNVRELSNAVAHRIALGDLAGAEGLRTPAFARGGEASPGPSAARDLVATLVAEDLPFVTARHKVLDDFERRYVQHVLTKHNGNVSKAAAASGIARRYFYTIRARSERG